MSADQFKEPPKSESKAESSVESKSLVKLVVSGFPQDITDDQAREMLVAFGPIKSIDLVKDSKTGLPKGHAFCEYVDPLINSTVIQALNGIQIAGKPLTVRLYSEVLKNLPHVSAESSRQSSPLEAQMSALSLISKDEASPTEVLCLLNMVTAEMLENDDEYKEIVEDIQEECKRFGRVKTFEIPRPNKDDDVPGVGKVFVEYETKAECQNAFKALAGRYFATRRVDASYFNLENFRNRLL